MPKTLPLLPKDNAQVASAATRALSTELRLGPREDLAELSRAFAATGRVRIPTLLVEADAAALHQHLEQRADWWQLINSPGGIIELDRKSRARMTLKQRVALDEEVRVGALNGFQYRYEALRIPDEPADMECRIDPLASFARLMSSPTMLEILAAILAKPDIAFSDGQATAYGSGDLLTCHDDDVVGKDRHAAYVLGLTPHWRIDWGGLLLFHGTDGRSVCGQAPGFNTLDLFSVPQPHSVSLVTPTAPVRRYAITGWLKSA